MYKEAVGLGIKVFFNVDVLATDLVRQGTIYLFGYKEIKENEVIFIINLHDKLDNQSNLVNIFRI